MKKSKTKLQGRQILKKYIITNKIGTGAFGQIYRVVNKLDPSQQFAVKLQPITSKYPQLIFQAKLYKYLHQKKNNIQGIPKVYGISMEGGYNLMVMDLLGKSLEDLFSQRNKRFTTKTILMIGLQILQRIQFLHSRGFLHRDIKPDNMLIGTKEKQNLIFLVDYGLSKKYIKDGKHIGYRQGKELTGTARYASIHTHKGIQQSRRDDVESLAYVMMYFFRGILPWQNMPGETQKQKYDNIMKKKIATSLQSLCRDCPSQMIQIISYSRKLKFQESPDYEYIKDLLKKACERNNYDRDGIYDWNKNSE